MTRDVTDDEQGTGQIAGVKITPEERDELASS
jgi:hypothetical protein